MTNQKNLEDINKEALEKIFIAQPILNKLISNPQLADFHDPVLSRLGDSRWNRYYVSDTLSEIMDLYGASCYNNVLNGKQIPREVKNFVRDFYNYKFKLNF